MGKSTERAAFQFALDLHSGVPVYRQLIDQVRSGVASGSLTAGDQLPTVRQLGTLSTNGVSTGRSTTEGTV